MSTMAHVLEDDVFFCPCTHKPPQTYAFTFVLNPNFGPKTPTPCTFTYCAFSNLQYVNVHRLPLCDDCTCVPQWLSYKVVRRPSPWGTWTFQITFPGERGGFLFTMTLPSKRVSATFRALFFSQVKRFKSEMENKYLHPFISLATLHCTAVSIVKIENVSTKTFNFLFKPLTNYFS